MATTAPSSRHVVLFPFMAKGHTIPLFQFACLLLHRNATVTLFTTPANQPYVTASLFDTRTTIISIPFPDNIPSVPSSVESVDKLPSMSLFFLFASSTQSMQPYFEKACRSLKPAVSFMVTDGFFTWTVESANKLNIPRLVYYGMSNFSVTVCHTHYLGSRLLLLRLQRCYTVSQVIIQNRNLFHGKFNTDQVVVPEFPWMKVTSADLDDALDGRDFNAPYAEWIQEVELTTKKSYGLITNSFFELEPEYLSYWNLKFGPKSWCVGPFCLDQKLIKTEGLSSQKPSWMVWLDKKLELGNSVLYVAFGSQAEISLNQIKEIKLGLERSEVNFLWVMRRTEKEANLGFDDGFEERVKEKGIVVREWVNQREILEHEIVKGFLSHCGWNSTLESICAAVLILAWPLNADQPLNAKFVVEVIKIGLRVESCDGNVKGFVKWEMLEKKVKELMEGVKGKEMRKKVKEISNAAVKAVEDGGSSWRSLNELIDELQAKSIVA